MPTELRESQVAVLRTVDSLGDPDAGEVSRHEERWFGSTERSLIRLAELGYLDRREERNYSGAGRHCFWSVYELTDKGKAALLDREGSR